MSKKMIDADALIKALKPYMQSVEICDKYAGTEIVEWEDLQIEINKLAPPAPEPQGKMIDFDVLMKCVNSLYTRCQVPNKGDYSLFMISKDLELSNIFMNCLDVLVKEVEEISTIATKPRETINNWNTNFEEAPQDYDTPILIKYYCDWKKCERITVGHYEEVLGEPDYTRFYTWYETGCTGENKLIKNLISWKSITNS